MFDSNPINPPVFVINLDARRDRWETICALARSAAFEFERFRAVDAPPGHGWVGCGRSHQGVVRHAKTNGFPWVLILEDDCFFTPTSIEHFRSLLPILWETRGQWDRFCGGPNFFHSQALPNLEAFQKHHFLFTHNGLATHFDLINESAYDQILTWEPFVDLHFDKFYLNCGSKSPPSIRSICSYPYIATQSFSESSINPDIQLDMPAIGKRSANDILEFIEANLSFSDDIRIVHASHADWTGRLLLSTKGFAVQRENTKSFGTYTWQDGVLAISWFRIGLQLFEMKGNELVFKPDQICSE